MAKYQKKKTYWIKKNDKLFSEIVRLRDKVCRETSSKDNLQCAHIISRSYKNTRWDFDNAITLTIGRHKYYTHHPLEWKVFINKLFGKGYYEKLEKKALQYKSYSLEELKEVYDQIHTNRGSRS